MLVARGKPQPIEALQSPTGWLAPRRPAAAAALQLGLWQQLRGHISHDGGGGEPHARPAPALPHTVGWRPRQGDNGRGGRAGWTALLAGPGPEGAGRAPRLTAQRSRDESGLPLVHCQTFYVY